MTLLSFHEYKTRISTGEVKTELAEKPEITKEEALKDVENVLEGHGFSDNFWKEAAQIRGLLPIEPELTEPIVPEIEPSIDKLNNANPKELQQIKGIGQKTAQKIVAARPFHSLEMVKEHVSSSVFQRLVEWLGKTSIQTQEAEYNRELTETDGEKDQNDASQYTG